MRPPLLSPSYDEVQVGEYFTCNVIWYWSFTFLQMTIMVRPLAGRVRPQAGIQTCMHGARTPHSRPLAPASSPPPSPAVQHGDRHYL